LPTVGPATNSRMNMPLIHRLCLALIILLLAGCSGFSLFPYRMNIQQGNYLDADDVQQVEVGMTRSQVRFLIGTPMIADPFQAERWDYVFFFKVGRTRQEMMSRVTVWFEGDRVVRIDRPEDLEDTEIPEDVGFDA
jgi:outer membrane protein assembly factor BamE